MTEENVEITDEKENEGFAQKTGRALGSFFKFLIRLTFTLVLAIALGAGIYYGIQYGVPALDQNYVQPIRDNTTSIVALEAQATKTAEQYDEQIEELQERLNTLELQSDSEKEVVASLEVQVATLTPLLEGHEVLAEQVALLDGYIEDLGVALDDIQNENLVALEELDESVALLQEENAYSAQEIYLELQFVKAMSLITRAQLYLSQEKLGADTSRYFSCDGNSHQSNNAGSFPGC